MRNCGSKRAKVSCIAHWRSGHRRITPQPQTGSTPDLACPRSRHEQKFHPLQSNHLIWKAHYLNRQEDRRRHCPTQSTKSPYCQRCLSACAIVVTRLFLPYPQTSRCALSLLGKLHSSETLLLSLSDGNANNDSIAASTSKRFAKTASSGFLI